MFIEFELNEFELEHGRESDGRRCAERSGLQIRCTVQSGTTARNSEVLESFGASDHVAGADNGGACRRSFGTLSEITILDERT